MFHSCVIAAIGYNRTWSIALRFGTHKYGGLQIKILEVEALIKKLQCQKNTHALKKTHKLIIIVFSWFQHIAGKSFPILENNNQTT